MNQLLDALQNQYWAMDPKTLDSMAAIVIRHASGEKLADDEINQIVAQRSNDGDEEGMQVVEGIAVIPIQGVITKGAKAVNRVSQPRGTATGEIQTAVNSALMRPDVKGMVLNMDTPGGSVKAIEETSNMIFKARKTKPIVMFASDATLSAGIWLGSQATMAIGNGTAMVGSIGVYMVVVDSRKAAEKAGFVVRKIATGPLKGAGEPGTEVTAEQLAAFQIEVDDILTVFVRHVARGRRMNIGDVRKLATGGVWIGAKAVSVGLLDRIGSLGDAISEAQRLAAGGKRAAAPEIDMSAFDDIAPQIAGVTSDCSEVAATLASMSPAVGAGRDWLRLYTSTGSVPDVKINTAGDLPQQDKEVDMSSVDKTATDIKAGETAETSVDQKALQAEATRTESVRQKEIRAIARKHKLDDEWAGKMCDDGTTLADARIAALEVLELKSSKETISVGEDLNLSSIAPAIEDSLMIRAGLPVEDPHARHTQFLGMSIVESMRNFLVAHNHNMTGLHSRAAIVRACMRAGGPGMMAIGPYGNTVGDYPKILENIITKRLLDGYKERAGTWTTPGLMQRGTLPDFKQASMVALGLAADLQEVAEGATYTEATIPETREKFKLVKYGRLYSLTWEQMVNDDLNAFTRIPFLHGAAAARLENVVAWQPLTDAALGAVMDDDSKSIFHADHNNLVTSGGAPDAGTQLQDTILKMTKQTGLIESASTAFLNLNARFLVVPPELEHNANLIMKSTTAPVGVDGTTINANPAMPNIYQGSLIVVREALIGTVPTHGPNAWYLFAGSADIDTILVSFLEGEQQPFLDQADGFESDGRRYKVRHTVTSKAIDFRGMVMNDGVT